MARKCNWWKGRSRSRKTTHLIPADDRARLLRHLLKFPLDRSCLRAWPFQNNLQGATQANRVGEENAFLYVEFGAFGKKAPNLPPDRRQRHRIRVARKLRRNARMQMETDGEAPLRVDDVVADGRKLIVAFELQAGLAKRQPSAMEEAESLPIAIVPDPNAQGGVGVGDVMMNGPWPR